MNIITLGPHFLPSWCQIEITLRSLLVSPQVTKVDMGAILEVLKGGAASLLPAVNAKIRKISAVFPAPSAQSDHGRPTLGVMAPWFSHHKITSGILGFDPSPYDKEYLEWCPYQSPIYIYIYTCFIFPFQCPFASKIEWLPIAMFDRGIHLDLQCLGTASQSRQHQVSKCSRNLAQRGRLWPAEQRRGLNVISI